MLTHKRDRLPKRVLLTTNTLKHSRNRWLRLDSLTQVNRFCRIEGRVTPDGRLKIRGDNFEGFTLVGLDRLMPGKGQVPIDIEHQQLEVRPEAEVSFHRVDGNWKPGKAAVASPAKTEQMTDTIIEAFREKYILVVGTGAGAEAELRRLALDTINAIQNSGRSEPLDLSTVPSNATRTSRRPICRTQILFCSAMN